LHALNQHIKTLQQQLNTNIVQFVENLGSSRLHMVLALNTQAVMLILLASKTKNLFFVQVCCYTQQTLPSACASPATSPLSQLGE